MPEQMWIDLGYRYPAVAGPVAHSRLHRAWAQAIALLADKKRFSRRPLAKSGRKGSHSDTACRACRPTGTILSLFPLPVTRTVWSARSTCRPVSRSISSAKPQVPTNTAIPGLHGRERRSVPFQEYQGASPCDRHRGFLAGVCRTSAR